jgi:diguanylate cyclase (GGDEF)-like protein
VPVDLLVGVLLLSVVANATLLFRLSRSDRVKFRWPGLRSGSSDSSRGRPAVADPPRPRRRSLFVAESPTRRAPVETGLRPFPVAAVSAVPPAALPSLSQTLPADLADFLARPATIAAGAEGLGFEPPNVADHRKGLGRRSTDVEMGLMARLPHQSNPVAQAMTVDSLTGLEGPASWSRIIEIENARLLRYRRPVTVVMVEVEGLRRLAERLGDDPVDRLLPVIADALRREARATDWVARISDSRFAAFLPETDEIQAINYVERIRLVCEPWLASSAVPLWLAIGWSGPTASSDLEFALLRAEERMHADRRMPGRSIQLPRVVPGRVVSVTRSGDGGTDSGDCEEPAVPPAETGRSGERMGPGPRSDGPAGADPIGAPRVGEHHRSAQTASSSERRNEV